MDSVTDQGTPSRNQAALLIGGFALLVTIAFSIGVVGVIVGGAWRPAGTIAIVVAALFGAFVRARLRHYRR
jgi:hypothetical protein